MFRIGDVCSLAEFQRRAKECIKQLKESGQPQLLTINGKAEIVVQDIHSYEEMIDRVDRLEAIYAIRKGLEEIKAGEVRPFKDVIEDLKAKYEIPD